MEYKHREAQYWEQRFRELEKVKQESADKFASVVEQQYNRAIANIDSKIERFIRRYAINDKLSMAEATKYLTDAEFAQYKMSLEEYIRLGQENALNYSSDVARDLERASLEYRITRLAALETELKAEVASIYGLTESVTYQGLGEMYPDLYGRTAFEIFKGLGVIDTSFALPNMELVDSIIRTPWSSDGQTFSMHLWRDQTMFTNDLMDLLTQQMINGEGYQQTARKLQNLYKKPLYQCKRVIYTESAFFQGQAQNSCYRDLGVEKYQFLSELNTKVCDICGQLDSKVFTLDERRVGVNAIPMHPNCRCVEVPYFEDDYVMGYRSGRNAEGKSVEFPPDMTYPEWKQQVLDGSISELNAQPIQIRMGTLDQQLPKKDYDEIKRMVEEAPEPFQKLWNTFADKIQLEHLKDYQGSYDIVTKKIRLHLEKDSVNRYDIETGEIKTLPRSTFFHEVGHLFDNMLSESFNGKAYKYYFSNIDNGLSDTLIEEDVHRNLWELMDRDIRKYFPDVNPSYIRWLDDESDELREISYKLRRGELTQDEVLDIELVREKIFESDKPFIIDDFIEEVENTTTKLERYNISDIYEKFLNREFPFGVGHGLEYWKYTSPTTEAFAEFFSAVMTKNEDGLNGFKRFTPQLYDFFNEEMEKVVERLN